MDDTNVRSRRVGTSKTSEKNPVEEKEKMLLKNRKQPAENYEFGDVQKVPANVREIIDRNFHRLFLWEFYFGTISLFCQRMTGFSSRIHFLDHLLWYWTDGDVLSDG